MKKINLILVLFAASFLTLSSCDSKKSKVIAIVNLQRHPILDAIQNNVLQTLSDSGFVDGKDVKFVIKNANGQTNLIPSIANEIESAHPDIIITVSTPITQQFIKNHKAPIVFGAVTDPIGAGIITSLQNPGAGITGTSDVLPYEQQLKLIRQIQPTAKRLGIIYNPAESSSIFAIKHLDIYAPKFGFILIKKTVSKAVELPQAASSLINECDAIIVSSDNTVTGGLSAIVNIAIKNKKPLYAGDEGSIQKGAIASYSINYNQLGKETGKLAVRVLRGKLKNSIYVSNQGDLVVNEKAAELMGVIIPDSILKKAVKRFKTIQ